MLSGLILENFKAFGGRRTIPIRPLTLIFGPNSAGKSAILQSLLLLKQTATDPDTGDVPIRLKGSLVDLGSFREMVFRHELDRVCEITPILRSDAFHASAFPTTKSMTEAAMVDGTRFGMGVRFRQRNAGSSVRLQSLPLYLSDASEPVASVISGALVVQGIRELVPHELLEEEGQSDDSGKALRALVLTNELLRAEIALIKARTVRYEAESVRMRDELESFGVDNAYFAFNVSEIDSSDAALDETLDDLVGMALTLLHPLWRTLFEHHVSQIIPAVRATFYMEDPNQEGLSYQTFRDLYYEMRDTAPPETVDEAAFRSAIAVLFSDSFIHFVAWLSLVTTGRHLVVNRVSVNERLLGATALPMLPEAAPAQGARQLSRAVKTVLDVVLEVSGAGTFPTVDDVALELSAALQQALRAMIYVGPLRGYPARNYLYGGASPENVGTAGQLAPDILINRPDLLEEVNKALLTFNVGYKLDVQRLRDEDGALSDVFTLRLVDVKSGVRVSLRDVGFGISQVLPVLVQSLLAENNTVLIEQPELHLHPRLQAELADVFIESALGDRKNTFLIETHSEHLILRIMRRLRDTSRGTLPEGMPELRPDDVSIIYVHPMEDGSGSVPLVMDLDEEGDLLTAWPNGFFEEGFHERFA